MARVHPHEGRRAGAAVQILVAATHGVVGAGAADQLILARAAAKARGISLKATRFAIFIAAGGFVGFLLLVGVFYRPLEKIAAVIETYPRGIAGFRRYQELLATDPEIADAPGAIEAPALRGDIEQLLSSDAEQG